MKRTGWRKKGILLGVGFLLFGCATVEDVRILDSENRRLHSQLNVLQKDVEPLLKGVEGYRKEAAREITALQKEGIVLRADFQAEMKKIQTEHVAEMKKAQADFRLQFESLQAEIRNVSTGVEEYKDFAKKPTPELIRELERLAIRTKLLEEKGKALEDKNKAFEERIRAADEKFKWVEDRLKGAEERAKGTEERLKGSEERFKGLDSKVDLVGSKQADLDKKLSARESKEKESPPPPPPDVKPSQPALLGSADLYKDGLDTFYRGDMEGARKRLETFLKNYPNTELSDNAQFWIGETYYRQKDYERAILEYEKVIVKYPEGDKVSAAMLKQGLAFLELGDKTNARSLLRRIVERYPQSEQAELARKRLEGLK